MGKHRHSKDRLFVTKTEWQRDYGGKKSNTNDRVSKLPFDCCALALTKYITPVCSPEGILFDYLNIATYLKEHNINPCNGNSMKINDLIKLNMYKNENNDWMCPVTCKVFNDVSHVVAIKTTGNVYSYDAINELNIKTKNFTDLMDGTSFTKADIIILQDPSNDELNKARDINNFTHLQQSNNDNNQNDSKDNKVKLNATASYIMEEVNKKLQKSMTDEDDKLKNLFGQRTSEEMYQASVTSDDNQDVVKFLQLRPLTSDLNPGHVSTSGQASSSLTSSSSSCHTSAAIRLATSEEIRESRWKVMKALKKKGYVQIQTNIGNINLEIHCDITPIAAWNFITLCTRNYYDNCIFHRLIPNFMIQGGDPTGTGKGGQSAWLKSFKDEIDSRLSHDARGILSMANSGPKSNRSQFFITFDPCKHLDLKHTVFGRLVGGMQTLNTIEQTKTDKDDRPITDIKILKTIVFTNPIDEADQILFDQIKAAINTRLSNAKILPFPKNTTTTSISIKKVDEKSTSSIGKYVSSSKATDESIENFLKSQQRNIDQDNSNSNLKRKFNDT